MTGRDGRDRVDDVARLWSAPVIPVEDAARVEARRRPTVDAIGRAIRAASVDKRRRYRRRALVGALSAAAAAVLALGIAGWSGSEPNTKSDVAVQSAPSPVAQVQAFEGALAVDRGGQVSVVRRGTRRQLRAGDAVVTELHSSGTMALSSLTEIDVASATRVKLQEIGGEAPRLHLERGHVGARVDEPHDGRPKLVVDTPDATIVVVGTVFTVDVSEREATDEGFTAVAVLRGTVVVQKDGVELARVNAGQTWSSRPPVGGRAPEGSAAPSRAEVSTSGPSHHPRAAAPVFPVDPVSGTLAFENSLFQQAMAARNAGDDATVVRRMGELMRAFPQSPLLGEARAERQRALERLGSEVTSP